MKYSVCIDAVFMGKGSFIEGMRTVKECGYDAIEFWTWWDKDVEEIIKAKNELGLKVATFCTKFVNPGNATLQDDYIEGLKETIEVAKALDCKTIISQAGWEIEGISREAHRNSLREVLKKAAAIAEQENMTIVLEPLNILVDHAGYHLWSSKDAFELIEEVGSPNIKVLFDIYHQQITEGNLIVNIKGNIDKIGHFHAAGNPGRNEITKGEINYEKVFKAIKEAGYNEYVGLEYMTDNNVAEGLIEARKILC